MVKHDLMEFYEVVMLHQHIKATFPEFEQHTTLIDVSILQRLIVSRQRRCASACSTREKGHHFGVCLRYKVVLFLPQCAQCIYLCFCVFMCLNSNVWCVGGYFQRIDTTFGGSAL